MIYVIGGRISSLKCEEYVMKKSRAYTQQQAMVQFLTMLRIWSYNIAEARKQSLENHRVMEILQSLDEAVATIGNWAELEGSIQLIVAYQPSMFDYDDGYDERRDDVPF